MTKAKQTEIEPTAPEPKPEFAQVDEPSDTFDEFAEAIKAPCTECGALSADLVDGVCLSCRS